VKRGGPMSNDMTVAEWREEVLEELRHREQKMRSRPEDDSSEYWSNVANGLSEARDVVEQVGVNNVEAADD